MAMEQRWQATRGDAVVSAPRRGARASLLAEVRDALFRPARELPSRFLADAEASPLRRRLQRAADETLGPVELPLVEGALAKLTESWSPRGIVHLVPVKSRAAAAAIDAAVQAGAAGAYIAVAAAAAPGDDAVDRVRAAHPGLTSVTRVVADLTTALPLPRGLAHPRLVIALGNAIGTFGTIHAIRALRLIQASMHAGDRLLLGVDLRRDPATFANAFASEAVLRTAYHRHALRVLERDLGAGLDAAAFDYRPRYDADRKRVEHRLVATDGTQISIPGLPPIQLARGEGILTAVSCTFERAGLFSLLAGVGLSLDDWIVDARGTYAVATASPAR